MIAMLDLKTTSNNVGNHLICCFEAFQIITFQIITNKSGIQMYIYLFKDFNIAKQTKSCSRTWSSVFVHEVASVNP